MLTSLAAQTPKPPPDAGSYPEPVDVPRYLPAAERTKRTLVAAAHPLAAKVGADILRAGGNAIDALVATQMALNVVEPQSSGIGGGCFILYYDAKTKETYFIDGREEVPAGARREDFLTPDGRVKPDALTGGLPTGTPGTVAAMWLAHQRWGKLPIARVLEPAIRLAEDGIGVTPRLRVSIAANRERFLRFPASRAVFLRPDGAVPELGEVLKQPDLARTFRLLAEHGPKVFYEGEIAQDIVKAVQQAPYQPGKLSLDDLRNYRAVYREPVRFTYRGYEVISAPPPSSGGITLGEILGMLEPTDVAKLRPGSVDEIDLLARVCNAAFADRNAYLGDQDWSPDLPMRALLDREYIRRRAAAARQANPGAVMAPGPLPGAAAPPAGPDREGPNTTHIAIIDADRNVVSCTTTIEHGMGSGQVVPGRGFLLNNELTDFDLDRAAGPNALDPTRRPRRSALTDNDQPAGKRPRSSMTPVIVFRDGRPYLALGSPGGARIIGIVAQVLVNVLDHGMDIQQAINAPRVDSRNGPLALEVLYPHRRELCEALRARGWQVRNLQPWYEAWGGAQGIRVLPDGTLEGGADPRREGAARGD
jgi:gamma-glutamyltranspeptidase/glutathione hydrolase